MLTIIQPTTQHYHVDKSAQFKTTSSRHNAILINPGPPALYQLTTEKSYINGTNNKVRRWTYGKRDANKQNRVILLVGETGAGKTTMINTMVNYLLGVKFKDEKWYEITEEIKDKGLSLSQTSEITVYEAFVEENPTSLTFIDLPGIADTDGFKREREIAEHLIKLFSVEDGIGYIDAVCFVMKATQKQLSEKEHYMFHLVLSLFGRDIEDNTVFLITHSDGGAPEDALNAINTAQISCRKDERKRPVHFLFNNQQKEKREHAHKSSWIIGKKSMKSLLTLLSENNRKSLQMTADDVKEPKQLESCIFNLMDRITEKEFQMKELTEILTVIRQNRDKIDKSENFSFTVNKTVKKKIQIRNERPSKRKATYCRDCEENCHLRGCWWVPFGSLRRCDVMKDDHCTVCTGKCHHSRHEKSDEKYEITTSEAEMSFNELKQKYGCSSDQPETSVTKCEETRKECEKSTEESKNTSEIEEKLNSDLKKIKTQKSFLLNEAYMTIMKRSEISLESDSYLIPEDLDFFIRRLQEENQYSRAKEVEIVKLMNKYMVIIRELGRMSMLVQL
ncbi:uncharacterized protein [Garra rufa]|uniref:uncharacterized protein n=1 Tax=Garra rufa TaxID=137080 RepID=UPI003CCEA349